MEDDDGEGSKIDSSSINQQLTSKDISNKMKSINYDGVDNNDIDKNVGDDDGDGDDDETNKLSNCKVIHKGFKKHILTPSESQENHLSERIENDDIDLNENDDYYDNESTVNADIENDEDIVEGNFNDDNNLNAGIHSPKSSQDGKITEYAQYLGLQPAGKYKCSKCNPAATFHSIAELKQHECVCQPVINNQASTSLAPETTIPTLPTCSTTTTTIASSSSFCSVPSTSDHSNFRNDSNFHIPRKVYLCSACHTYFENWNLFLHMREIHKRHLCLFCLGMFGQAERLSYHLAQKHSVPETLYQSIDDFYLIFKGSCYLICCTCEKVFTETDNFYSHYCQLSNQQNDTPAEDVCSLCRYTNGEHSPTCQVLINQTQNQREKNHDKLDNPSSHQSPQQHQHQHQHHQPQPQPNHFSNTSNNNSNNNNNTFNNKKNSKNNNNSDLGLNKPMFLPNPANALVKRLLISVSAKYNSKNNEKTLLRPYQRNTEDNCYNKKFKKLQFKKRLKELTSSDDSDSESSFSDNSSRDIIPEALTHKYNYERRKFNKDQIDQSKLPINSRYCELLQLTRRSQNYSNLLNQIKNEGDDRFNNFDESEDIVHGELILDDGLEDSANEETPQENPEPLKPVSPVPLQPEEIPLTEQQPMDTSASSTVAEAKMSICSPPNPSTNTSVTDSANLSSIEPEFSSPEKPQSPLPTSDQTETLASPIIQESQPVKVNTNRSLVIKISNKNSQFSISTPNGDGVYESNADKQRNEDDEEEEDDDGESEENNPEVSGELGSDKEMSDQVSDSDSGKLTVALKDSEPEEEEDEQHLNETKALEEPIKPPEDSKTEELTETKESEIKVKVCEPEATEEPPASAIIIPEPMDVPENCGAVVEEEKEVREEEKIEETSVEPEEVKDSEETVPVENTGEVGAPESGETEVDLPCIDLNVDGLLECMDLDDILKRCIAAASPTCIYCNHARHIAVNGKELAQHMLNEHRFQPQHPAIIIQKEQFINKVKKCMDDLELRYFNLDSYDSTRGTYQVPTVRTYECYLCRIYYTVHKELYLHNRKMHQKPILICIMCKSTFYNYSELLCHLCPGSYAANINIKYRCCLCNIDNLPSSFRLMVHLRKRHNTCEVCLESTGTQQKLSNHVWKHKLNHLCYRCGIAYRNKPDITKHLFWKHGTESVLCKKCLQKKWPHVYHFCIPPNEFVCDECSSIFTKAVALKVHKRLHTGDEPYSCTECQHKFISRKLLNKHEDSHKPQPELPPVPPTQPISLPALPASSATITQDEADLHRTISHEPVVLEPSVENNLPKEPVRKVVDVYDLPPLNLSSDSDSEPEEEVKKPEEPKVDEEMSTKQAENEKTPERIDESEKLPTEISTKEDESEEAKKEEVVIMNGIWDNFKSYTASLEPKDPAQVEIENNKEALKVITADHDYCVVYEAEKTTTEVEEPQSQVEKKESVAETPEKALEEPTCSEPVPANGETLESPKKKAKSPKKKKQQNDGASSSSSDSSSDSDSSSCSCGTNCSCSSSSSGSSSSSSSSSDSDSSASGSSPKKSPKKDRRKEMKTKLKLNVEIQEEVPASQPMSSQPPENGIPDEDHHIEVTEPNPSEVIDPGVPGPVPLQESDLETDETDTDEDFYDEYPQQHANKLLAEKRNQLVLLATPSIEDSPVSATNDVNNGTIENPNPGDPAALQVPQPQVPPSKSMKRKVKTKRRKKSESKGEGRGRGRGRPPGSTNQRKDQVESLKLNIPKLLYRNKQLVNQSPAPYTPKMKLPAVTYQITPKHQHHQHHQHQQHQQPQQPMMQVPENIRRIDSDDKKRSSKRKRVPKKFYGDSSDEDGQKTPHSSNQKWRRLDNSAIPYVPSITIKQNYGPPPSTIPTPPLPSIQPVPVANNIVPSVAQVSYPNTTFSNTEPPQAITEEEEEEEEEEDHQDTSSDSTSSDTEQTSVVQHHQVDQQLVGEAATGPQNRQPTNLYCYCRCPYDEVSEMIACDGDNCRIEWFHFECVGIRVPPKGKWYCPDCRKQDSSLTNTEYYD